MRLSSNTSLPSDSAESAGRIGACLIRRMCGDRRGLGTTRIDGMSQWIGGDAVVFVASRVSTDRQRFTIAHGLGHLVLHSEYACRRVLPGQEAPVTNFAGARQNRGTRD